MVSLPEKVRVSLPAGNKVTADMVQTDDAFWHIFPVPLFSRAARRFRPRRCRMPCAVLSAAVARRLLRNEHAERRCTELCGIPYIRCGDEICLATRLCAGVGSLYVHRHCPADVVGGDHGRSSSYLRAPQPRFPAIREEAEHFRGKYNDSLRDSEVFYRGQPDEQFPRPLPQRRYKAIILRYMLVIAIPCCLCLPST